MIGENDFGVFFNPKDFGTTVIFHTDSGQKHCNAIFRNPSTIGKLKSGGAIEGTEPTLLMSQSDANAIGIQQRQLVTVGGQKWFVVLPPESDGAGMTVLTLGRHNEHQSRPDIHY